MTIVDAPPGYAAFSQITAPFSPKAGPLQLRGEPQIAGRAGDIEREIERPATRVRRWIANCLGDGDLRQQGRHTNNECERHVSEKHSES
jgi:hypothetical protein